jgi:hypothetical protein
MLIFAAFYVKGQTNKAYGDNMVQVDTTALGAPIFAIYSGDINQDGYIDAFDFLDMDPDIQAGNSGYLVSDANGDGFTDAFDFLVLDPNIQAGIGLLRPF